ncbi:MAG: nitronate monooxygenase [Dehalococcoidia bacterium]|jgi:NAD(P)H-dependent flavin oxidoreductase YrpB (nitropropane dioxygenase family)
MKTRITELLGIRYPIIQAGMSYVSYVPLAAAVSNAGGLGIMTASEQTPEELLANIGKLRELTKNPFGVNLVPYVPRYKEMVQIILNEKVPVFSHGLGNPFKLLNLQKPAGMIFMPTAGNVRQAQKMEREGADAIIMHGFEGGGHVGYVASTILLPEAAHCLSVPIAASGGFCDGRGLIAAMAMGADGIAMGSRFAITRESPIHENVKAAALKMKAEDTVVSTNYDGLRLRSAPSKKMAHYPGWWARPWEVVPSMFAMKGAFKTSFSDLIRILRELKKYNTPLIQFMVGIERVRSTLGDGKVEDGIIPAGQVMGRFKDVPTCQELIDRIMAEAEDTLSKMCRNGTS